MTAPLVELTLAEGRTARLRAERLDGLEAVAQAYTDARATRQRAFDAYQAPAAELWARHHASQPLHRYSRAYAEVCERFAIRGPVQREGPTVAWVHLAWVELSRTTGRYSIEVNTASTGWLQRCTGESGEPPDWMAHRLARLRQLHDRWWGVRLTVLALASRLTEEALPLLGPPPDRWALAPMLVGGRWFYFLCEGSVGGWHNGWGLVEPEKVLDVDGHPAWFCEAMLCDGEA